MAIIYKCDRCGAVYEKLLAVLAPTEPSYFNGFRFVRTSLGGASTCYSNVHDLCPDCMAELRDWFTMETRKENDVHGQTDS